MIKRFAVVVALAAVGVGARAQAPDAAGTWQGTLQVGKGLRTVLKTTKADAAGYKSVFYSIDQGGRPIPVSTVSVDGATVRLTIDALDGKYEGKLSPDGSALAGTFTQGGHPLPLNFVRATKATEWAIPDPPARLPPMAADAKPNFEVATIKPSNPEVPGKAFGINGRRFSTLNTSLSDLMQFAYGISAKEILGAPEWALTDKYDLAAQPDGEGAPSDTQWKGMLQKLLTERFKLGFHHDKKELSIYSLVVGKAGPKLTRSQSDSKMPSLMFRGGNGLVLPAQNATLTDFTRVMQAAVLDRPVVNNTGLEGRYDFTLRFTPDDSMMGGMGSRMPPPADGAEAPPSLFTAIQDQLGLRLDPVKAPVDVFVVDHVEKPSAD